MQILKNEEKKLNDENIPFIIERLILLSKEHNILEDSSELDSLDIEIVSLKKKIIIKKKKTKEAAKKLNNIKETLDRIKRENEDLRLSLLEQLEI